MKLSSVCGNVFGEMAPVLICIGAMAIINQYIDTVTETWTPYSYQCYGNKMAARVLAVLIASLDQVYYPDQGEFCNCEVIKT